MIKRHHKDVYKRSHASQISIPVATTLAEFLPNNPNDPYFVPHSMIRIPLPIQPLTEWLFPNFHQWENQWRSENGDKKESANLFLHKVLPFLTKCIVQDGVFWIKNFPNNSAVQLLLRQLDRFWPGENYSVWARKKREEVDEILRAKESIEDTHERLLELEVQKCRELEEICEIKEDFHAAVSEVRELRNEVVAAHTHITADPPHMYAAQVSTT